MKKILIILFCLPLYCTAQFAAIVGGGSLAQTKSAASTSTIAYDKSYSIGNLIIFTLAKDNFSASDGDPAVGGGGVTAVSDNAGNTYTKAAEFENAQTNNALGAAVAVWYCVLTNNVTTSNTITATHDAETARACGFKGFTIGSGSTVSVQTTSSLANDNADAGAITLSSLPSREYLFIRAEGIENNTATNTPSTNYTALFTATGTTGGSAVTNMWVQGEYRILTGTTDVTNPTTGAADIASLMVAFYEVTSGPPPTPIQHNLLLMGTGKNP